MIEVVIKSFALTFPVLIAIERRGFLAVLVSFLFVMAPIGLDLIFNFPKDLRWILQMLQIAVWLVALVVILKSPISPSR